MSETLDPTPRKIAEPGVLYRTLPRTLDAALTPAWLNEMLGSGAAVPRVNEVEVVARVQETPLKPAIVRFKAHREDGSSLALCLKAVFENAARQSVYDTSITEAFFFNLAAPRLTLRIPPVLAAPVDPDRGVGFLLMRDMVVSGAHFCSALEPFDAPRCASILEQLARLHAAGAVLGPIEHLGWVKRSLGWISDHIPPEEIQGLMDDERGEGLPARTRDAHLIVAGLKALAALDAERPTYLIHGDSHAGNIFETSEGLGLTDWQMIQKGGWAIDVAYHIVSVLPVEVAEREERGLLAHYLDHARRAGAAPPDDEQAWLEYRQACVYGMFLWAITKTVHRPIINEFTKRLAAACHRHDTYRLLGL